MLQLIVGLGNYGDEYENTRHNVAWWLLDKIASKYKLTWQFKQKFHGELACLEYNQHKIYLLKPHTYMNRSGLSVSSLALFYKILPSQILAVHDELDLDCAMVRLKKGGGHAGHNGLKSLDQHLQTPNYWRLRLGIGHPRRHTLPQIAKQSVADYVLNAPNQEDKKSIEHAIDKTLMHLPLICSEEFDKAMMQLHKD